MNIHVALGVILGLVQFVLKIMYPRKLNIFLGRFNRVLVVIAGIFIIVALIFAIIKLFKSNKVIKLIRNEAINIALIFILGSKLSDVFKYVTEFVYFGEKTLSSMSLLRTVGYLIGIGTCILVMIVINRLLKIANEKYANISLVIILAIMTILYVTAGYSEATRLKYFGLKSIFALNIFSTSFMGNSIYLMLVVILLIAIYLIIKNSKLVGNFANKALVRKERARIRKNRRWSYFGIFLVSFVVFSLTYLNYIDTKEVELSPPEDYQVEGNNIVIPLDMVNDGHLHRFSLKGKQGKDIRFLVVKKPQGSSYGLGLDACEICGVAGYYERKDEVVCKRCDVVMNKATIGFKGGCNPIPFEYAIENSKIIIDKDELYSKEDVFR